MNRYHDNIGAVHISAYMCNYPRALGRDGHMTLIKRVKEQLEAKYIAQGMKWKVDIRFSRSAYISGIKTPNAKDVTAYNYV